MIKEAYCSFEVAKLLKEKGFGIKEETRGYYPIKGDATGKLMFGAEYHHNTSQVQIAAPTHQMAMAWIVEKYNVSIEISALKHNCWVYTIYKILDDKVKELYNDGEFKSHEEAVEAALKYSLENLI